MNWDADVGIVGAGPAGARAAEILATAGKEALLFDPKAPWEKPCGGGLTPPIFEEVPELNELKSRAQRVDVARIEIDPSRGFRVPLDRPVWILSRRTLAEWQLDRARSAGARHVPDRVRQLGRTEGGWVLRAGGRSWRVRLLVGADGGASLVRRTAAPKMSVELAPTRVAYPSRSGPTPDTMVLKFYDRFAGYLWDFPRPTERSVGIGVPNSTWQRRALDREIDEYRDSSEPCGCPGLQRAGAVIGTAQLGHGDFAELAGDDYALLGDAAGLADPLTGEGIQNAMRSSALFAEAFLSGDVRSYTARARAAFEREFAVSRALRRGLLEGEATRFVGWGIESNVAWAAVVALTNAINQHDGHVGRLVRRWVTAWRQVRAEPDMAGRVGRSPSPCECDARAGAGSGCNSGVEVDAAA